MIWFIIIVIVGLLLLLLIPFCFILLIGYSIGALRSAQESAWKEAAKYNRSEEEWQNLTDEEKRLRINCIAIILDDCGSIHSDEEIINYLKGRDSVISFTFKDLPQTNEPDSCCRP